LLAWLLDRTVSMTLTLPCRLAGIFVLFLVVIGSPASVLAQQPSLPLAWEFGYQLAHIPGDTLPLGFGVGFVGRLAPTWSVVGEVAGAREAEEAVGTKATFSIFDVGGGVRWTPTVPGSLSPFVQFVAGAVTRRITFEPEVAGLDQTETDFLMQPGVGVAWKISDTTAALATFKFTETLTEDEFDIGDEYRIFLGVRLSF
jgi:hypothetical protein